ncbi:MAG: DUF6778 family protein, partial [Pseudomonadota bacterium]
ILFGVIASATLAACAGGPAETTRNVPATASAAQLASAPVPSSFNIQSVLVEVPRSLTVSESNRYYPGGDIVWREDPLGDRHMQVKTIVEQAMIEGVRQLTPGTVPAVLHIEMTRFHALTEKARYTVGGVHSIQFMMSLRDPQTGQTYGEPKFVKADFDALGGQAAVRAEQAGRTQKVRITKHLIGVLRAEMTQPGGYVAGNLGLFGAINNL